MGCSLTRSLASTARSCQLSLNAHPIIKLTESIQSGSKMVNSALLLRLSREQTRLMRVTWLSHEQFLYQLSSDVYGYIFEHSEEAKRLFPTVLACGSEWHQSSEFRLQALRFAQILDNIVRHLGSSAACAQLLQDLGERHVQYVARGFHMELWQFFKAAMPIAMRKHLSSSRAVNEEDIDEILLVWQILADFIVANMETGFMHKQKHL